MGFLSSGFRAGPGDLEGEQKMIKKGGKLTVQSLDGGKTINYEYTEPDPNEVEVNIDGWWVVWDVSVSPPRQYGANVKEWAEFLMERLQKFYPKGQFEIAKVAKK